MYRILNRSVDETYECEGDWPSELIECMLECGDDVLIVSFYSNTLKIPRKEMHSGVIYWEYDEYDLSWLENHLNQ